MTRVYYFTRTGDSAKIAAEIAKQTGGDVFPISDGKSWAGAFGYIRAGFYASFKKELPVTYVPPLDGDTVYLCFPVWAGNLPPAVRSFAAKVGRARITAVPSSMGSGLKEREEFLRVIDLIGDDKTVKL